MPPRMSSPSASSAHVAVLPVEAAQVIGRGRGPVRGTGHFVPAATLKFEHLVLAIGGVVDVSRVPGMPEHGYVMKTVGDAIRLRVDLIQRLEESSLSLDPAVRRRLLTFVVVGGGQ